MRRLDQWLSNLGYCSRREARDWMSAGQVTIDGVEADDPSQRVGASAVKVDGQPLDHPDGILLLLNKPLGLVCSHDGREGPSVYDLLPDRWRRRNPTITTIGRLDKDTSGALLLTDQSPLVHRLTSPKHKVPKLYRATLDHAPDPRLVALFAAGSLLLEGEKERCAPAELRIIDTTTVEVVMTEGRYHQVRRMFSSQGCPVLTLHRVKFGQLEVEGIPLGTWKELPLSTFD